MSNIIEEEDTEEEDIVSLENEEGNAIYNDHDILKIESSKELNKTTINDLNKETIKKIDTNFEDLTDNFDVIEDLQQIGENLNNLKNEKNGWFYHTKKDFTDISSYYNIKKSQSLKNKNKKRLYNEIFKFSSMLNDIKKNEEKLIYPSLDISKKNLNNLINSMNNLKNDLCSTINTKSTKMIDKNLKKHNFFKIIKYRHDVNHNFLFY